MCDISGIVFGASNLSEQEIEGKDILEAGAYDVNGSLRPIILAKKPKSYIGTDITAGPGVDIVLDAGDLVSHFGEKSFDVVITTEMLEHAKDWQQVISSLKNLTKPGGLLLVTTRSKGMDYHAYPYDYWRYEKEDMEKIFSDFEILKIEKDTMSPGIFLKMRRPENFKENDLKDFKLYSIVTGEKQSRFEESDHQSKNFKKIMFRMRVNQALADVDKIVRATGRALIGWKR